MKHELGVADSIRQWRLELAAYMSVIKFSILAMADR